MPRLGVREYYVYDPLQLMRPPLRAFRRVEEDLIPATFLPHGGIWSDVLGTELRMAGRWLRVIDPRTGQFVPVPSEQTAGRRAAEDARRAAEDARQTAEARATPEAQDRMALEA